MKAMTTEEKQLASLEALEALDTFCRANRIRYYLAYGTLIGAVRNKGFIPWDDDIDVHMPRPDYEKFIEQYNDPNGVFKVVSCYTNKKYILPYAKLQNTKTARVFPNGAIDEQGIGIDLFPLEGITENVELSRNIFVKQNRRWLSVTNRLEAYRRLNPTTVGERIKHLTGCVAFLTGFQLFSVRKLSKCPTSVKFDDAINVATFVGIYSGRFVPFEKRWFEPIEIEFENRKYFAPEGYHAILSLIYGDYMTPPPENQRMTTHSDKFIWRDAMEN